MSIAENSYNLTGMFEAELLVELMLKYWNHPYAKDGEFRQQLLESASAVLVASINGEKIIEGVDPSDMNLVAAVWYAEVTAQAIDFEKHDEVVELRKVWSQALRHSVPSCFSDPDDLV